MFDTAILNLLLAILASSVTPALACPPPLNNFNFIGNETHTSAQLIKAALLSQDGLGWTEGVSTHLRNPIKTWPRDSNANEYTIPYCFANQNAKVKLSFWISNAITLWIRAVGDPGKNFGHGLQFKNYEKRHEPPFCRKEDGTWNNIYPTGSVIIDTMDEQGEGSYTMSYASYGYQPEEYNSDPGRHGMCINYDQMKNTPKPVALIVHEWGHIVGMMHEHQRRDAVTYVHFECKNLADYGAVKKAMDAIGSPGDIMEDVCTDGMTAVKYGSMANDWTPTMYNFGQNMKARLGAFDLDSVMLYDSKAGMMPGKDANSIEDTVLVRWKEAGPHPDGRTKDNCEVFGLNPRPSEGDYGFVKNIYPWEIS